MPAFEFAQQFVALLFGVSWRSSRLRWSSEISGQCLCRLLGLWRRRVSFLLGTNRIGVDAARDEFVAFNDLELAQYVGRVGNLAGVFVEVVARRLDALASEFRVALQHRAHDRGVVGRGLRRGVEVAGYFALARSRLAFALHVVAEGGKFLARLLEGRHLLAFAEHSSRRLAGCRVGLRRLAQRVDRPGNGLGVVVGESAKLEHRAGVAEPGALAEVANLGEFGQVRLEPLALGVELGAGLGDLILGAAFVALDGLEALGGVGVKLGFDGRCRRLLAWDVVGLVSFVSRLLDGRRFGLGGWGRGRCGFGLGGRLRRRHLGEQLGATRADRLRNRRNRGRRGVLDATFDGAQSSLQGLGLGTTARQPARRRHP